MEFEIFRNFGVLGLDKKNVYTYGAEHPTAACSDCITVSLPENEWFSLYENYMGRLMVESSWGWQYDINEVLLNGNRPCFCATDKDGKKHSVYLKEVERYEDR